MASLRILKAKLVKPILKLACPTYTLVVRCEQSSQCLLVSLCSWHFRNLWWWWWPRPWTSPNSLGWHASSSSSVRSSILTTRNILRVLSFITTYRRLCFRSPSGCFGTTVVLQSTLINKAQNQTSKRRMYFKGSPAALTVILC